MPDFNLKNKLKGIIQIKEEDKFKNRIKNFKERLQVDYNNFSAGIGEKQEFIDAVCRHKIRKFPWRNSSVQKKFGVGWDNEAFQEVSWKSFSGAYIWGEICSSGCNQESIKVKSYT